MNLKKRIIVAKLALYNLLEELEDSSNEELSPIDSELLFQLQGDEDLEEMIEENERY